MEDEFDDADLLSALMGGDGTWILCNEPFRSWTECIIRTERSPVAVVQSVFLHSSISTAYDLFLQKNAPLRPQIYC
jgi:hypothetical protein